MLASIHLHDKLLGAAQEIGKIGADRELSDEFMVAKFSRFEFVPQCAFREIIALAKSARKFCSV